ncbi:Plasmodium exported protein, unknown function [Plasmodium sp. gorilla clade G2]|uniref:Plasmodium exported protein, unknown function n=1 Tax=Plasmodium sp. gorilla clade G2 TaxID=880535 RepID=UPI000D206E0F|nr:Plasmodium exported protein, unknown function [Plasmodium sp. gorilla clade G2]SOV13854.1 Plasmodium exported protein, unknown function [Plasmodium sp. gorilla clade G2]
MGILYSKLFLFIVLLICILSPGNNTLHKYVEIKERINNLLNHPHLRLLTERIPDDSLNGLRINEENVEDVENKEHEGYDNENDEDDEDDEDDKDYEDKNEDDEEDEDEKGQNKPYQNNKYHKNNKNYENDKINKYDKVHINDQSNSKASNDTDEDGVNYETIPIKPTSLRNGVRKENIDNNNNNDSTKTSNNIKIKNSEEQTAPLNMQQLIEKSLYDLKVGNHIYHEKKKYADEIIDSMKLTENVKNIFKELVYYYLWKREPGYQLKLYKKIEKDIEKYSKNHVICTIIDLENLEDDLYYLQYPEREIYRDFDTAKENRQRRKIKEKLKELKKQQKKQKKKKKEIEKLNKRELL